MGRTEPLIRALNVALFREFALVGHENPQNGINIHCVPNPLELPTWFWRGGILTFE
jgi:hypothetical protein